MGILGYKDGDIMDEDENLLPDLDLDKVFHLVIRMGGMMEGETLDKAQAALWSIKESIPFVKELTERLPPLLDTAIDGLQEAAARRGRPPVIKGVLFPNGTTVIDDPDDQVGDQVDGKVDMEPFLTREDEA